MDDVDIAQHQMLMVEELQRQARERIKLKPLVSNIFCDHCDDEIPEKRRLAVPGVKLCVYCQTLEEQNGFSKPRIF